MTDRVRELLAEFDPSLPLDRARTIPASWYSSPEMAVAERRCIFGDSWLVVGRADQVVAPGSFLTADVAGWPILVVRDHDGFLRAFFNVCRHRAALLLTEPCGQASRIRCRYHGWTYDLAGRLRGTPDFEGVAGFSRDDNGLQELAVQTWGPFVAVHLGKPEVDFAGYLAPLPADVEPGLRGLQFVERREYQLHCNWKLFVDNYLDGGYHVNTVHPELAGMLDYSHYRTEIFDWTSVQTSPLTTSIDSVRTGSAQYWYIFPNLMLNLYQGVMDTNLVLPLGSDRCRVIFDFYFAESGPASEPQFQVESVAVADRVQMEDAAICENVQRGLTSGVFNAGRFSVKREIAGYHFHRLLARRISSEAIDSENT